MSEEEGSGRDMMYVSSSYDDVPIGGSPKERIIEASPDVIPRYTLPCPTCGRTFVQASLERHVKVCEKVLCTKRKVFPIDQKRTKELPKPLTPLIQKKVVKPPDEFLICKYCGRKFGYKAFDRHESWCEERSKRMQLSPNKDMVALAKLQMRNTYRPKTPIEPLKKKEEIECSKSRRTSNISYLYNKDHIQESDDTQFVRSATGRGSIKKGPAQTKASQLRQLKNEAAVAKNEPEFIYAKSRSVTPGMSRSFTETPPMRQNSFYLKRSASTRTRPVMNHEYLVRPNVLRPTSKRFEPEGIEMSGDYDHSIEYDPYQLAANQMNELLFGSSNHGGGGVVLEVVAVVTALL
nr:uncharacterized protein LOC121129167 [Lepeophtheirus salmonis]